MSDIETIKSVVAAQGKGFGRKQMLVVDLYLACTKVAALEGKLGSLRSFKAMLVAACAARALDLTRCDMVQGLDLAAVADSEIRTAAGGTVHMVTVR
jgi:hypothetical protein